MLKDSLHDDRIMMVIFWSQNLIRERLFSMGKICDDIKYYVTSYQEEITGNNTICRIVWPNGRRVNFALDCGLFQESSWNSYNDMILPYEASDINFAIATHAHTDHIGRFPFLVKCGFKGDIYTSFETKVLFPIMINETFSHMQSDYKKDLFLWKLAACERKKNNSRGRKDKPKREKNCCKKRIKSMDPFIEKFPSKDIKNDKPYMLFDGDDIDETMNRIKYKNPNETFSPCEGVEVTFLPNGHIWGAIMVYFHIFDDEHEINFLATGDLGMKNRVTSIETSVPSEILNKTNFILSEATYGYEKEPRDKDAERAQHCQILKEFIAKKGTIMYMSNSLERPQVILRDLKEFQELPETAEILKNVPIYLDTTLGIECHRKYEKYIGKDFIPKNFQILAPEQREGIKNHSSPKIIICTSPRFDQGSFLNYGVDAIDDTKCALIFTSYTPPWVTNIIEAETGYKFEYLRRNQTVTKMCKMYKFRCYSAHVSKQEMENFLGKFTNVNTLLFNHGTTEGKRCLEQYFKSDNIATESMLYGRTIVLTHQGIVKTY